MLVRFGLLAMLMTICGCGSPPPLPEKPKIPAMKSEPPEVSGDPASALNQKLKRGPR